MSAEIAWDPKAVERVHKVINAEASSGVSQRESTTKVPFLIIYYTHIQGDQARSLALYSLLRMRVHGVTILSNMFTRQRGNSNTRTNAKTH